MAPRDPLKLEHEFILDILRLTKQSFERGIEEATGIDCTEAEHIELQMREREATFKMCQENAVPLAAIIVLSFFVILWRVQCRIA